MNHRGGCRERKGKGSEIEGGVDRGTERGGKSGYGGGRGWGLGVQ